MKLFALIAGFVVLGSAVCSAQGKISYNYLEAGYGVTSFDIDGLDVGDGDGFTLAGSLEVGGMFFLFAEGEWADLDGLSDVSSQDIEIGAGIHYSLSSQIDIVGRAAWQLNSFDVGDVLSDLDDEDGVVFDVGLRAKLTPSIELGAFVGWENVSDVADGAVIDLYGMYQLSPNMAIGVAGALNDASDSVRGFIRLNF